MYSVKTVSLEVMRKAARAADAGNKDCLLGIELLGDKKPLDCSEH
jgi:hypothetical protein